MATKKLLKHYRDAIRIKQYSPVLKKTTLTGFTGFANTSSSSTAASSTWIWIFIRPKKGKRVPT